MSAELERLKAWMERNGYTAQTLCEEMGYERLKIAYFNGARALGPSFQWRFGRAFKHDALMEVFGLDIDDGEYDKGYRESVWSPDRAAAHGALGYAVTSGKMPAAKKFKCHACDKPAVKHHHSSYHPGNHLCVTPLCESCHTKADRGSLNVDFGVVPTQVGLVRIAIAST